MTSRHDSSEMDLLSANQSLNLPTSFGRMSQGSGRHSNLMNPGPFSKLSHQGSHGMQSFNSDPETSKILASFGLSSRDLEELSRYPEEKITPDNLPQIIQQIKRRGSEDMAMLSLRERSSREPLSVSSDAWDDTRPFRRENFNDRSSGLDPVDYDHRGHSQDPAYRGRLEFEGRLRERDRLREEHFLPGSSYHDKPMGYSPSQERPAFKKFRGRPSKKNIKDFIGKPPNGYPYICSLCDAHIFSQQSWNLHANGRLHSEQCQLLLNKYPEWQPVRPGLGDSYIQQSTNAAAGMHMGGGPEGRSGGQRSYLGKEAVPGPRRMQKRQETGRVVHVMDFKPGKTLKYELLKLAEPFGVIANYVIVNKMREAFIEMSTPKEAMAFVDFFRRNPAIILGKSVKVFLSRKYECIKKPNGKADNKPEPKPEVGRVLQLRNLPRSGYTETAIVKLAEAHGKVKTYILMRSGKQAFIEMEKAEDANAMVEHCAKTPLMFRGNRVNVTICSKYKSLVLKFPNKNLERQQKGINRKRAHSPDTNVTKKKKTESSDGENESQMVTTEEADQEEADQDNTGTKSSEPELDEKDEVVTSSSVGDKEEMVDTSQFDLKGPGETQGPNSSTPIAKVTDVKKKKPENKADYKPELKPEIGRVLQLSNLPFTGYADSAIWKMAKGYGNVKTYVLMRRKNQALVEMEKAEDANTMVNLCAKLPILFRGKKLKVAISKSYKNLQKFPNRLMQPLQKEKNRTRGPLTNFKNGTKEMKTKSSDGENKTQMVTTEEADQTESCEDEVAAIMETSSFIVDGEMVDTSEVDTQDKTSTRVDEAEQENKSENKTSESTNSQMAPGSVSAAETDCSKDLGPYKLNNPIGLEYVVPGFYCKLCSLFYTTEKMAKVTHCSGLPHYQKLKQTLSDVPEKKD